MFPVFYNTISNQYVFVAYISILTSHKLKAKQTGTIAFADSRQHVPLFDTRTSLILELDNLNLGF